MSCNVTKHVYSDLGNLVHKVLSIVLLLDAIQLLSRLGNWLLELVDQLEAFASDGIKFNIHNTRKLLSLWNLPFKVTKCTRGSGCCVCKKY